MSSSPRILFLSSCWPCGPAFGGRLRALHIGRALKQVGDVTLTVVGSDHDDAEAMARSTEEFAIEPPVRVQLSPNKRFSQKLRTAFDPHFLNVHGCAASTQDRARLLARIDDFDLVWILNSRTPNILNRWCWPHSVLDVDDVPSTYQRSVWQNEANMKEKLKAGIWMQLLKRRERFWKDRFTLLSVCSEQDRKYLGGGDRIHVIPNGFDRLDGEPQRNPANPPRIGFIGLYRYPPNLEGVRWFVENCWPLIKREIPDARFRLVGKDTDGPLKPIAADMDALGWVADSAAEMATWSTMIIPVRQGAGTRVKIADAFSHKCPVVSTSFGAFGYEVQHSRELLLADDPAEFAAACISLVRKREEAAAMAERAFNAFIEKWTWDAIAPRICAAAEDALRRSRCKFRTAEVLA